jgi:hypothetical protein
VSTAKDTAALPEIGYYTDANGLTWQLSAAKAAELGFTAPDKPGRAMTAPRPAGPAPATQ